MTNVTVLARGGLVAEGPPAEVTASVSGLGYGKGRCRGVMLATTATRVLIGLAIANPEAATGAASAVLIVLWCWTVALGALAALAWRWLGGAR